MGINQADIDALLSTAGELADSANSATAHAPPPSPAPDPAPPPAVARRNAPVRSAPGELRRILRMKVPVIVVLAERNIPMASVLGLTSGSIIEFEVPSDAELALRVVNKCVGRGHAVKVGENFGLRITSIGAKSERVRAMGSE